MTVKEFEWVMAKLRRKTGEEMRRRRATLSQALSWRQVNRLATLVRVEEEGRAGGEGEIRGDGET
jgi:hypothetical protein